MFQSAFLIKIELPCPLNAPQTTIVQHYNNIHEKDDRPKTNCTNAYSGKTQPLTSLLYHGQCEAQPITIQSDGQLTMTGQCMLTIEYIV